MNKIKRRILKKIVNEKQGFIIQGLEENLLLTNKLELSNRKIFQRILFSQEILHIGYNLHNHRFYESLILLALSLNC